MKSRSRITVQGYIFVCLTMVLTLVAATAIPAWSAPAMSQELKTKIMNRMPIAAERGKVLQSTARAVENGFPEDNLAPVIEKSLDSRISGYSLSRMIDALDRAHGKGLPTQPYAEKIMEGLAKKVKEDRILYALEKVGQRMEFAAAQAEKVNDKGAPSRVLIIRTSDAIAAGMDRENLERVYDVMSRDRTNQKIEPEEIMEMVKAASGYGVDSRSVGDYAISLMKNRNAVPDDIRKYLEALSEDAYRRSSGSDAEDNNDRHSDPGDNDDGEEEGEDDGDDDGEGDGDDDGEGDEDDDGDGEGEGEEEEDDESDEPDEEEEEEEEH